MFSLKQLLIVCFLPSAILGIPAASAQEYNWSDSDLPEWFEDLGYEDADYDGPLIDPNGDSGEDPESELQMNADSLTEDPAGNAANATPASPATGANVRRPNPNTGCFRCRKTLTGDWCGLRSGLMQNGIFYRGRTTQFFFGVSGGIQAPVPPAITALGKGIAPGDNSDYTGTSQHDFIISLDQFGGMKHSKCIVTMENIWGRFGNVSGRTGDLTTIFNAFMPADNDADGVPRMTNFFYIQPLSEQLIVGAGKLRLPGLADQDVFAGGDGTDQFVNQAFAVNPLFVALMPISTFAVTAVMPQSWGNMSLAAIDPVDRSTDYFDFGSIYSEGCIVQGQVKLNTNFLDMPGQHHIGGIYKNADLLDLRFTTQPPEYPYPPGPPSLATKPDTGLIYYGFDQYLQVHDRNPKSKHVKGWGLFGRAGIADGGTGNPNWMAWTSELGIGGDSPLQHRRAQGDRFGIGYCYVGTSTEWGPIPTALLGPRDAQIFETFYRYHWSPSVQITPDVQWVKGVLGGLTGGDDAFVYGIRMNIIL